MGATKDECCQNLAGCLWGAAGYAVASTLDAVTLADAGAHCGDTHADTGGHGDRS